MNAKTCFRCGGDVEVGVRDTNKRYCSVECRERYWEEKRNKGVTRGEWVKGRHATPVREFTLNEADARYVAGFMDGEGHVGVGRETRVGNRSGFRYRVVMEVANTNKEVLERIQGLLGGNGWIGNAERNTQKYPNAKPLYRLRFSRGQIVYLLPLLLPHFIVKRRPALVVLRFLEVMGKAPMRTSRVHNDLEALYRESRALNKRGTSEE